MNNDFGKISATEEKLRKLDNRDKLMRTFEVFVLFILVIITLVSLYQLNQVASSNAKNIQEHRRQIENGTAQAVKEVVNDNALNRARLDVSLCIFSVSPIRRTPEYTKSCYDQIEQQYHAKIQRFGDGQ